MAGAAGDHAMLDRAYRMAVRAVDIKPTSAIAQGGLKWWSQHSEEGGCDEDSTTAFGWGWSGTLAVTRPALGGRTR